MDRLRDIETLRSAAPLDLLVIGGGAAGAATLRCAALAGMRAALCERHDFAAGISSRSSRLVHGGLRYLEHGHLRLVREALGERRVLLRIAPHLVAPLALHIPLYRGGRRGAARVRAGLWLYDRLAGGARLGDSALLGAAAVDERLPGLERCGLAAVGRFWDARLSSPERLIIDTLLDAERLGALAVSRVAPLAMAPRRSGRLAVRLADLAGGGEIEIEAGAVVNATGPWVGEVDRRLGAAPAAALQWSRGSHILLARFAGAPEAAFLAEARRDGRPFFVLPAADFLLVGTTEEPHAGDPATAVATPAEIDYLLAELAAFWPAAAGHHPYASYAGVRPLPAGRDPHAADRRHRLVAQHPPGAFAIVGGKLTTHRRAGEEAVRAVARHLGLAVPPQPDVSAARPLHAAHAAAAAAPGDAGPPIAGAGGLRAGDLERAWRTEGALELEDVLLRRTQAALAPDFTAGGLERAAALWVRLVTGERREEEEKKEKEEEDRDGAPAARALAARTLLILEQLYGRDLDGEKRRGGEEERLSPGSTPTS